MIPAFFAAIYIRMCTKITQPPERLIFLYSLIGFVMSISWIGFTCSIVVDLLDILGLQLGLPKTLLGLTLLAWGNCLGDMNANVAMTKKGFGEMAITGCMAGPVFNVLMGLGLSTLSAVSKDITQAIPFKFYNDDGKIDQNAAISVILMCAEMTALFIIFLNAKSNNFHVSRPLALVNIVLYAGIILLLVIFTLVKGN
jgi:sodium/potassium/calcium exchanger 6